MASEATTPDSATGNDPELRHIFLVSYPKIVFLYPTFVMALIAAIYMSFTGSEQTPTAERVTLFFLAVFALNLVVLAFDFPRTTSLALFFAAAFVGIGLAFLFHLKPDLVPFLGNIIGKVRPFATASFYYVFVAILFAIYLGVLVMVKFDYWEVRPNELLHHHGLLSDLERFSAPSLRIDKEINDVFEYALLGAGRLVLHPSNEKRSIILDNVFFINKKETQITRMLGALQVQLRSDNQNTGS